MLIKVSAHRGKWNGTRILAGTWSRNLFYVVFPKGLVIYSFHAFTATCTSECIPRTFHAKIHKGFHPCQINAKVLKIFCVREGHKFSHVGKCQGYNSTPECGMLLNSPHQMKVPFLFKQLSKRILISVQTRKLHVVPTAESEGWRDKCFTWGEVNP